MSGADPGLRRYCDALTRFIAARMVDPHRHFEQQLVNTAALAPDAEALEALALRLLQWADGGLLEPGDRRRLDAALAADGLPSPALFRDHRALARALLDPAVPPLQVAARVEDAGGAAALGAADRALVAARCGAPGGGGAGL